MKLYHKFHRKIFIFGIFTSQNKQNIIMYQQVFQLYFIRNNHPKAT